MASVLLVSTVNARRSGQDVTLIANMRQLSQALEMYYQDHGVYPTDASMTANCDQLGYNPNPENFCIVGQRYTLPPVNSSGTVNELKTLLQPYLASLPSQLIGGGNTPPYITLELVDPSNADNTMYFQDFQSNTCWHVQSDSYVIWGMLNLASSQQKLNGIKSQGYTLVSSNNQQFPCP